MYSIILMQFFLFDGKLTLCCDVLLPTALGAKLKESEASVCPSSSVRLFPFYLLNRLTFGLALVCVRVWVMTIARLRLKVNGIGQGQMSMYSVYGRGNAVIRSL